MSKQGPIGSWAQTYFASLKRTPSLLLDRIFLTKTFEQMVVSAQLSSKNSMKRTLGFPTLVLLCIGHMIGGGIFILTGVAARTTAGPAVTLSYIVGGILASCTALTYCELAADYPLAGGSFNYILGIWGEFPAWLTIVSMAIDQIIGSGALARGWSSYLASLCNYGGTDGFIVKTSHYDLDFVAFGFMILVTLIVIAGTQQTSWVNTIVKVLNLLIIVLVLGFTFPHANSSNWTPYFPFGARGVFQGAALIFFAYGGYNASANLAEEAKDPKRDVPLSIVAAMVTCTVLYVLMCIAITLAKPYFLIDRRAPFSVLFKTIPGWHWASYLIAVGAVMGVGTVVLVAFLTNTREYLVMARHNLIPQWLAHVNKTTGTPIRISVIYGAAACLVALLTEFETLAKMTNVGSLFVVSMVGGAALWRRYAIPPTRADYTFRANIRPFIRLGFLIAFSIAFTALWCSRSHWGFYLGFGLPVIGSALSFYTLPQTYQPNGFKMPFVPGVCGFAVFGGIFLMGNSGSGALWRFSIVLGICIVLYVLYGVHACNIHDKEVEEYMSRLPSSNSGSDDITHEKLQAALEVRNEIANVDGKDTLAPKDAAKPGAKDVHYTLHKP